MGTEVDDFLAEMLPKQVVAETAIHNGDVEPRLALWSRTDPVTVFGAKRSGTGWAELDPMFHTVASWFSDSAEYDFEVVAAGASGDYLDLVAARLGKPRRKGCERLAEVVPPGREGYHRAAQCHGSRCEHMASRGWTSPL